MKFRAIVAGLVFLTAAAHANAAGPNPGPAPFKSCLEEIPGHTSDQPPDSVMVCKKLFPSVPYVHLPADHQAAGGDATIYGVVELDINTDSHIQNARFYDRNLKVYALGTPTGKPIDETSVLMKKNHLPSNRVHYLVYEATGRVAGTMLLLKGLRPAILVEGHAIDERFLGPWEGLVSKRRTPTQWFTDPSQPANFAKIRVNFAPPLTATDNIGALRPTPKLPDGTRFKATGRFENATTPVRLSTGDCAAPLTSYGAANPLPDKITPSNYFIRMWRFPAMHTLWSKDFHVVIDYPPGLYASATAMASNHNFRLKDYIATSTHPQMLTFVLHGNPVDQILFELKPVTGGGGACK